MKNIKKANELYLVLVLFSLVVLPVIFIIIPDEIELFLQFPLLLIPAIYFIKKKKYNYAEAFNLKKFNLINIPAVLALTILIQYPVSLVSQITSDVFGDQLGFLFDDVVSNSSLLMLILSIALAPAICEELLFRGILLNEYKKSTSIRTLVIMNGLLFGIFHMNIQQFSYAFIFGVLSALVVYLTDSIYPSIIMHFINNFISVIEMKYPGSYFSVLNYIVPSGNDIFTYGVLTILSALSIVATVFVIKHMAKINGKPLSDNQDYAYDEVAADGYGHLLEVNIFDSMKMFEEKSNSQEDTSCDQKDKPEKKYAKIEEIFTWHLALSILFFIIFSVLVSFLSTNAIS